MKVMWMNSLASDKIAMNSDLYKELLQPQKIIVHCGMLEVKLNVLVKNDLLEGKIGLPVTFSDQYTIPKDIPYEIYYKGGALYLGPVIAYVASGSKLFNKKSYAFNLPAFLDYNSIKGLIITCTESSIDVGSGLVEGYYLNPKAKNRENAWRYGKFPLPNVIFNRSFMSQEKIKAIENKIGKKIFNSYLLNLDKWNIWKFLSKDKTIKKHLPYTQKFSGIRQLKSLLDKYGSLYLKPCNYGGGKGVMKVDKTKTGITLIDDQMKSHYFSNYEMLSGLLKNRMSHVNQQLVHAKKRWISRFFGNNSARFYLVQQAVPFKKNNRQVDFRVFLQKNSNLKWASSGLVARIAREGSIITNRRGREMMTTGRDALTSIYGVNEKRAKQIESEIANLIIRVVKKYEELGFHLGDVAADITLDANLNIWLLELQLYYSIKGWQTKGLREFYIKLVTTPFKYAKAIAGFNA